MKIIDAHTHTFPDELAGKAIPFLENEGDLKAQHNGTVTGLLKNMDISGIEKSVVLSIATKPSQVGKINGWAVQMTKEYSEKLLFSGTLHPDSSAAELEKNLSFLYDNNISVIKMHPEYQYFCPLNVKMDRIYRLLIDYDMTLFFHTGRDIAYVGSRSNPKILLKVLKKYPKLRMVAAHFGSYNLWDDTYEYLAGENIYFDTSFTLDYIQMELFYKILEKHGSDLIMFGTDSPWQNEKKCIESFVQLGLAADITEKILYKNAQRLFFEKMKLS